MSRYSIGATPTGRLKRSKKVDRENARARMHGFNHEAYADLAKNVMAHLGDTSSPITRAQDVAEAVWRAATDPSSPMRIAAGADAEAWAAEAR